MRGSNRRVGQAVAGVVGLGFVATCIGACSQSGEPVIQTSTQDHRPSPNVVWIVTDQPFGGTGTGIDVDTALSGGIRVTQTRSVGSMASPASTRAALLTGLHLPALSIHQDRLTATPPAGVTILSEQLRRAGYYTSRAGPALHNLSLDLGDSERSPDGAEKYQPGLLGAWDAAGPDVDWRGRDQDWDLPCTVAFGCGRTVSSGPRPFFSVFNVDASDRTSLRQNVVDILTALETDGLVDDTAVFLIGLHKTDFELVVRWPPHLETGPVSDDPVSVVDLAPTALALAGVTLPAHMDGRVLHDSMSARRTTSDEHAAKPAGKMHTTQWSDSGPPKAAAPMGYPRGGLFHVAPQVDLSCETEGSSIIYTTERVAPFYWRLYDGPFRMRFWTLRAKCGRLGYLDSEVITYDFDIE